MMEIVVDAYEITHNVKYKTMFGQMYQNFLTNHGTDWMNNEYNDDITWIVIACTRASILMGNKPYLAKAIEQFGKMYARANTDLYEGDTSYYTKAIYLHNWSKKYLFVESSGQLNDAYDGKVHNWSSPYNNRNSENIIQTFWGKRTKEIVDSKSAFEA